MKTSLIKTAALAAVILTTSEPASLLAVFVAKDGAQLTTIGK